MQTWSHTVLVVSGATVTKMLNKQTLPPAENKSRDLSTNTVKLEQII